jgi:hypothetical protein
VEVICPTGQAQYFFGGDWTGGIALIPRENFVFARNVMQALRRGGMKKQGAEMKEAAN